MTTSLPRATERCQTTASEGERCVEFRLSAEALLFDLHLVFDLANADLVFLAPCLQILPSQGDLVDALARIRDVVLAGIDEHPCLRRRPFGLQPLHRGAGFAEAFGGRPRLGGGLVERCPTEMSLIEQLAAPGEIAAALVGEGNRGSGARLRLLDLAVEQMPADGAELAAAVQQILPRRHQLVILAVERFETLHEGRVFGAQLVEETAVLALVDDHRDGSASRHLLADRWRLRCHLSLDRRVDGDQPPVDHRLAADQPDDVRQADIKGEAHQGEAGADPHRVAETRSHRPTILVV